MIGRGGLDYAVMRIARSSRCGIFMWGALLVLCAPLEAQSQPPSLDFVIVQPGYPGSTDEASGFIGELSQALARAGGPRGLKGQYHNQAARAIESIQEARPRVAIVSLGFYLTQRRKLQIEPLLESRPLERFFLAAKKGDGVKLDGLKGQSVAGTPLQELDLVSRILFGAGSAAEADVKLWKAEPSAGSSKAIRDTARGKVKAVLLNEREHRVLGAYSAGRELEVIHTTEELPTALVVALGPAEKPATAFADALRKLPEGEEGKKLVAAMGIEGFVPVDRGRLAKLQERFDGGKPAPEKPAARKSEGQ